MTRHLAILWTVGLVVACLLPGSEIPAPSLPFAVDKWAHVVLFLGFGALWSAARPDRTAWVVGLGITLGIAIEILQGALPIDRSPDVLDAVADGIGLALGVGLAAVTRRWAASNE